uniref:Uncharacterized protein n=1 Tax=Arcella intermedia TaxID=1963864 RepID=A0A6B2LW74_9EUKA
MLLPLSAITIFPLVSIATPVGLQNWPSPLPFEPNFLMNFPSCPNI